MFWLHWCRNYRIYLWVLLILAFNWLFDSYFFGEFYFLNEFSWSDSWPKCSECIFLSLNWWSPGAFRSWSFGNNFRWEIIRYKNSPTFPWVLKFIFEIKFYFWIVLNSGMHSIMISLSRVYKVYGRTGCWFGAISGGKYVYDALSKRMFSSLCFWCAVSYFISFPLLLYENLVIKILFEDGLISPRIFPP